MFHAACLIVALPGRCRTPGISLTIMQPRAVLQAASAPHTSPYHITRPETVSDTSFNFHLFSDTSYQKNKSLTNVILVPLQAPLPRCLIFRRPIPYQSPTDGIIPIFDLLHVSRSASAGRSPGKEKPPTSIDRRRISGTASSVSSSPSAARPARLPIARFLPPAEADGLTR